MEWKDSHFSYKSIFGKHNHAGGHFSYRLLWILYSPSGISAQEAGPAAAPHHEVLGTTKTPKAQTLCFHILTRMDSGAFLISLPWHCPLQPPHLSFGFLIPSTEEQKHFLLQAMVRAVRAFGPFLAGSSTACCAVSFICEVHFSLPHKHSYLPAVHINRWFLVP